MKTHHFESFAAELEIQPGEREFKTILTEFFEAVAGMIVAEQTEFLGHLKGFCQGLASDYLQVSYVSVQTGVQIKGNWSFHPLLVKLTINFNVLGLEHSRLKVILKKILSRAVFQEIVLTS